MKIVVSIAIAACLAGCSSIPPAASVQGQPLERLRATLGAPSYEMKLANGYIRRFYTDNTSLVRTWRADFDTENRLVELVPATTSTEFAEIARGIWKKADILERFGPPYRTEMHAEGGFTSLFYLYYQYGLRWTYMVLTVDNRDYLVKAEVQRIDVPASARSRPDVP